MVSAFFVLLFDSSLKIRLIRFFQSDEQNDYACTRFDVNFFHGTRQLKKQADQLSLLVLNTRATFQATTAGRAFPKLRPAVAITSDSVPGHKALRHMYNRYQWTSGAHGGAVSRRRGSSLGLRFRPLSVSSLVSRPVVFL